MRLRYLTLLLLAGASPCIAQEKKIPLEELRALALRESYLVKQIDAEFAGQVSTAVSTRQRPNPELSVNYGILVGGTRDGAQNPLGVAITQPLRLSHFGTRQVVAELIEQAASADQKLRLLELIQKLNLEYARLWRVQQHEQILRAIKGRADKQVSLIRESAEKGILSTGEEKIFQAEIKRIDVQLMGIEAQELSARAALIQQVGVALGEFETVRPESIQILELPRVLEANESSPLSRQSRAALALKLSREQAKLARRDAFPAFAPSLNYERSDDRRDFAGFGFTIELPFSNRNQSEILKADADLAAAQAAARYLQGESYRDEISRLVRSSNMLIEAANKYEREVIPSFREALDFQEHQFQLGTGSVLQLWQTQRELLDVQTTFTELWNTAFASRAELSTLIGQEF